MATYHIFLLAMVSIYAVVTVLEREDVNPDQPDIKYGRTPLSWAAWNGHERVVRMLLERGDVNPDHADSEYSCRPLLLAGRNGHEGVVKLLLEREEVNPDQPDIEYGRTPLWWAAWNGHERVVKMLLERGDVNPDHADSECGRTPLSWAAENRHHEVVKMLLEREDINPDHADTEYGRTPLSWAAMRGHKRIIKMFLELEGISLDEVDTECGQRSLPSFGRQREGCEVDMQFRSLDHNTDITDLYRQPGLLSPHSDEPEPVSDLKYSISMSPDNDPPVAKPSMLLKTSSLWPFKFSYPLLKSDTHHDNTRPTLLMVVSRYSVISSCVRLLAFLASRKNSHNRTGLQAVRDAFAHKVVHFFVFLCLKVGLWNWRRQNLRRFRSK